MRKKALFIFALILATVLCSCAQTKKGSVNELLVELLEVSGENFEDNGIFYFSDAAEGEIGYFSNEDKSLMYGENSKEHIFDTLQAYAGFVSARAPAEIWIFECYSSSDTDTVIKMCMERADSIKVALHNTEWREKSENIVVNSHGHYVLFSFAEDSFAVENRLEEIR